MGTTQEDGYVNIITRSLEDKIGSELIFTNEQQRLVQNFYTTSDNYNVFEFYAMDVSQNFGVSPSFIPVIDSGQFTDVSAIAVIHADAINFSRLFKFKTDDIIEPSDWNSINIGLNNMHFGCGSTNVFNNDVVRYSNASVTVGLANKANTFINKTTIKHDFVRHLAKSITGGYAMSEIFTNEKELFDGVTSMDDGFNNSMNAILLNSSTQGSDDANVYGLYSADNLDNDPTFVALSCQNLVANLFSLNVSVKDDGQANGNAATLKRGQDFLDDLSNQTQADISDNNFYVMFRDRDVLALKLTYAPKDGVNGLDDNFNNNSAPGKNPIYSRSYKVYIIMDDPVPYSSRTVPYSVRPNPRPWVNP
jgi:hypothetical protein